MASSPRRRIVLLAVLPLLGCSSPERPGRTVDELRAVIEDYRLSKPDATEERVTSLFARLDADIAARRAEVAARPASRESPDEQLATLEHERRELQQAWLAARLARVGTTAGEALRGVGESLGRGLEEAGRRLRESLEQGRAGPPAAQQPER